MVPDSVAQPLLHWLEKSPQQMGALPHPNSLRNGVLRPASNGEDAKSSTCNSPDGDEEPIMSRRTSDSSVQLSMASVDEPCSPTPTSASDMWRAGSNCSSVDSKAELPVGDMPEFGRSVSGRSEEKRRPSILKKAGGTLGAGKRQSGKKSILSTLSICEEVQTKEVSPTAAEVIPTMTLTEPMAQETTPVAMTSEALCELEGQIAAGFSNGLSPSSPSSAGSFGVRKQRRRSTFRTVRTSRLNLGEIETLLEKVPGLQELDSKDRSSLAEHCTVKKFDPYAEVIRYGDMTSEIYVVADGDCRVFVPQLVNTLQRGDCWGESSLVKGEFSAEASLSASPDKELTLLCVPTKEVETLGLRRKLLRPIKQSSKSRYIARPEIKAQEAGSRKSIGLPDGCSRGRLATEVPEYHHPMDQSEKSEQDMDLIKLSVRRNQYLTELLQLSDAQVNEIACCMKLIEVEPGHVIIQKGDRGDKFYVMQDGLVEALLNPDPENPLHNVPGVSPITLRSGDSFGELALLYDSPRKASVVSVRHCSLWVLELSQWRNVLKKMPASRIDEYLGMLSKIPELCSKVRDFEGKKRKIADTLEEVYYMSGEIVVEQGKLDRTLYVIFEGLCEAKTNGQVVRRMSKGDYFGQESLFGDLAYPFTVTVASETATMLVIDRATLLMLGLTLTAEDGTAVEASASKASFPPAANRRRSLIALSEGAADTQPESVRIAENKATYPREQLQRVGILGHGSFAQVSLEVDTESQRLFALKGMSKKIIVEKGLKNMVLGERKALVTLDCDHPFLVSLIATFSDERCIYFLLEPALGGELFQLFSDHENWFGLESYAIFFLICVALGLEHIHSKRMIHRDIKLENVLLDSAGYARITDLGLAKIVVGKTYTVCGSADYLAPETLKQVGHNRAVDWWAAGILTFCMMSGRMPFDAEDVMQIYKNIVKGFRKEHFPAKFSTPLVDFIRGLCRKKPQERLPMLPGGIANLVSHPWLDNGDGVRWEAIRSRTAKVPWQPPTQTVEEMRASMKQSVGSEFPEYTNDDGSGWDSVF